MAALEIKSKDKPFTCFRCGGDANRQDYEMEWPEGMGDIAQKVWYNVPMRLRDEKPCCLRCLNVLELADTAEIHNEAVSELMLRRTDLTFQDALALVKSAAIEQASFVTGSPE